jgi:hypothetical protein
MSGIEAFPVELVYTNASSAWGSAGRTALELPKLDLVVREMNWFMYLPRNFKYHRFAGLEMVPRPNARGGNELELKEALKVFAEPFLAPNFLRFQARARQVEAGRNLSAIYLAQAAHRENSGAYSQTFEEADWAPKGDTRYSYYMGKDFAPPTALDESQQKVKRVIRNTKVESGGFQTFAIGNIDGDPVPDIWMIDENKNMVNLLNDVQLDELDDAALKTLQELKAQGVISDIDSVLKLPPVRVGPHASGILPIKLDIPQQGLLFQFHKLFPGEGRDKRPAKIAFWYMPNSVAKGFTGFSWLTLAAVLLIGIGSVVGFAKSSPENRNKLFRKTTITLGIVLLAWVGIQFAGWGVMLIISML